MGGQVGRHLIRRDVLEVVALGLVDLGEHPVHAAVDVVDADEPLAGIDQVHDRRRRPEARREREPEGGILE